MVVISNKGAKVWSQCACFYHVRLYVLPNLLYICYQSVASIYMISPNSIPSSTNATMLLDKLLQIYPASKDEKATTSSLVELQENGASPMKIIYPAVFFLSFYPPHQSTSEFPIK